MPKALNTILVAFTVNLLALIIHCNLYILFLRPPWSDGAEGLNLNFQFWRFLNVVFFFLSVTRDWTWGTISASDYNCIDHEPHLIARPSTRFHLTNDPYLSVWRLDMRFGVWCPSDFSFPWFLEFSTFRTFGEFEVLKSQELMHWCPRWSTLGTNKQGSEFLLPPNFTVRQFTA